MKKNTQIVGELTSNVKMPITGCRGPLAIYKAKAKTFFKDMKVGQSFTVEELGNIRHKHLQEIPITIWGQLVDRFINPVQAGTEDTNTYTGWQLLNAGTDLLWHKENATVATYNQNAIIVDGLCQAVA